MMLNGIARNEFESAHPFAWRGLVGCWPTSLGPSGAILRDVSGYVNHGALTNMDPATDWVINEGGWALNYDRSDDYVSVGTGFSTDVQQHTLTVWLRWTGSTRTDEDTIISRWVDPEDVYLLRLDSATSTIEYFTTNANKNNPGFSNTDITDGEDHFVVATCDGTTMRMYLDGVASPTTVGSVGTVSTADTAVTFGKRNEAGIDYFGGNIGNVNIYNRALSSNEIQKLFQIGPQGMFETRRPTLARAPAVGVALPAGSLSLLGVGI